MTTEELSFYGTLVKGKHDKFYSIMQEGPVVRIHYGRNGTNGHEIERKFDSSEEARAFVVKMAEQKSCKGYQGSFFTRIPDIPKFGETRREYLDRTGHDLGLEPFATETIKNRGW